jgi:cysteine-rich repeat protein
MRSRRRLLLVLALSPTTACYAPHNPVIVTGDDSGSGDSGSTSTTTIEPTTASTSGETSDSADTSTADGSDSTTEAVPICGDGVVDPGEVCDDGINDGSYGGCLLDCSDLGPHCGDAIQQGDEACDDGDQTNGNGCNIDCIVSGTVLWTQIIDGPAHGADSGRAVAVDNEDAIYAVAAVDDASTAWIRRFDAAGTEDWTQTFAGPANGESQPSAAAWGGAPELHVVGTHDASSLGNGDDGWLRRYTTASTLDGSFSWDNAAGTADTAAGVAVNEDGQQFVLGDSNRFDLGQSWNIWLRKLDADGDEMWTQNYDSGDIDQAGGVAIDGEGNIIAVGSTVVSGEGRNIWVRKYSTEGAALWTRTYTSAGDCPDYGNDVAVDGDDDALVVGQSCGDVVVRKYASDGSVDWMDTFDGPDGLLDLAAGVATDSQNAVVVAGAQWVNLHQDAWVRKYSSDGLQLWTYANSPDDDSVWGQAAAVAVDSTDAVVVVGTIQEDVPNGAPADIWVQKFAP